MPTLYIDTCALNRLTDDQTQPRVSAEAEAVNDILNMTSPVKYVGLPALLFAQS